MAYNTYFPTTYQPQQMFYQPQPQPQPQQTGIIWVQGEAGAKSYLVAPNSSVTLWDSEAQTIYIKSADASGMPSMKILDYTMRGVPEMPKFKPQSDFVTKNDLDILNEKIDALKAEFDDFASTRKEKK